MNSMLEGSSQLCGVTVDESLSIDPGATAVTRTPTLIVVDAAGRRSFWRPVVGSMGRVFWGRQGGEEQRGGGWSGGRAAVALCGEWWGSAVRATCCREREGRGPGTHAEEDSGSAESAFGFRDTTFGFSGTVGCGDLAPFVAYQPADGGTQAEVVVVGKA
ncbi:MAG: hypothetical protein OXQ29_01990 [Rhodospirillaceae bacterium]|nr:hypothetical protein [Rhodospirillaceae bacterium]